MKIFGKYNIDRCDLPTMFANVAGLLRFITLYIYKDAKKVHGLFYVLTYSAALAFIYVYIISMYWFVFIRCRETGDIVAATVVFSLGTNGTTCVTKFFFMNFFGNTVTDLVSRYLEWDAQVVVDSRLHSNLLKQLKIVKQRAVGIWVSLTSLAFFYIVRALLRPGRHFPEDLYVIYGLEPKFETPYYEISFFLTAFSLFGGVYEMSCVKALIVIMVGYIEAQLLALSIECSYVWDDAKKIYNERNDNSESPINTAYNKDSINQAINEEVKLKLCNISRFHVNSINILSDFDKFHRFISVVDFALTVSSIIAELLGKLENTYMEIPYTFVQIYLDCYIGQKLLDANEIFESAVYDCKWENFDVKNMKIVYLLLQNSQKARTITFGGVSPMNYVALMSIIKTTYSAYTTLESTVS